MLLLNRNECPYDLPVEHKEEVMKQLLNSEWNRYPTMLAGDLRVTIADFYNISSQQVFIGNGSSDIINHLISIFKKDCFRLVYPIPSFQLFETCADIYHMEHLRWHVSSNMTYDYENCPSQQHSIYIICNPNNPSGDIVDHNFITKKIAREPDNIFIIDEAYIEFSEQSLVQLVHSYDNVFVVRTLSKAVGLAGVRLGYVLCSEKMGVHIASKMIAYKLSHFNHIVGHYVFDNYDTLILPKIHLVRELRDQLYTTLSSILKDTPHKVYPSEGNFLLTYFNIENFQDSLENEGILISSVKYYPNFFRIGIPYDIKEISMLTQAIKKIVTTVRLL